ncbi:MAG TPA: ABC transporter substrate-binding protein [Egibacteraceae bacterium]|nr:ABC transporter substrate-binding protein [Egibacteraceae bacterium]
MPRSPLVVLCLALLLAVALVAPAAGQDDEQTTVRVAFNAFENNITPFTLTMQGLPVTHDLVHLVYDALFWSQAREEPEPWLAESAEPNDDFTEWTVTIRDGVTWHDGEPLTAEDVAFTYDYNLEVEHPGRYGHHVHQIPPYSHSEVVDDTTVTLVFDEPAPTFTAVPGGDLPIIPRHIWEGIDNPDEATDIEPVGSGPFEVVDIVPDQQYVLEANTDYFMGAPLVDRLELPIVPQPTAAFAALRAGQVDAVDVGVPPELVDQLRDDDDIEVIESTRFESVHLHFNMTEGPLSDPALRRAIRLAMDRQAIVDGVLLGEGEPGRDGWLHPEVHWADPDDTSTFDLEAAEELLDEAGYDERNDEGIRLGPDGEPLSFTVLVAAVQPLHQRAMDIAAQQVAAAGIQLTPEAIEPATLAQRRRGGEFDAFVTNLEAHAHGDPDTFYFFFGPGIEGTFFGGFDDEEFNAATLEASQITDFDERRDAIHELQSMFAEQSPAIVLYYPTGSYAHRPAAYDGWIGDPGHGTFTKRSFLAEYAAVDADEVAADDDPGAEEPVALPDDVQEAAEGAPWGLIALIVGLLAAIGIAVALTRRDRADDVTGA